MKSFFKNMLRKSSLEGDDLRYLIEMQNHCFLEKSKNSSFAGLLDEIALDVSEASFNSDRASKILEANGIVVLNNYFKSLSKMQSVIRCIENVIETNPKDNSLTGKKLNYSTLAQLNRPYVSRRGVREYDAGMIDIFRFDTFDDPVVDEFYNLMSTDLVRGIIDSAFSSQFKPENLNAYVNKGVEKTRDFHVDSYMQSVKVFLYLTDVTELSSGPYCYVLGSHKDEALQGINKKISRQAGKPNDTTSCVFNQCKALPVLGKAGTLVISDQQGVHRGFPQKDNNSKRIAFVLRYNSQAGQER